MNLKNILFPLSRYLCYILILSSSCHALAQSQQKFTNGLLWRIQKTGAPDSFVFGTIHLTDSRVTNLPAKVEEAFRTASTLCTEIIFDQASLQNAAAALFLAEGKSLRTIIGDNLYEKTASLLEKKAFPRTASDRLKPWAAMMLVMLPNDQKLPLDIMLYQNALQRGLQVCGLESVAEQTGVMDSLPVKSQILMLKDTVDNYAKIPGMLEKMTKLYLAGDLASLMDIEIDGTAATKEMRDLKKEFVDKVLIARNRIMVDRMQTQLKKGNAFIAVGALHLLGDKGILNLLEQQGYQATRIY